MIDGHEALKAGKLLTGEREGVSISLPVSGMSHTDPSKGTVVLTNSVVSIEKRHYHWVSPATTLIRKLL
jgi:hypothetical protein